MYIMQPVPYYRTDINIRQLSFLKMFFDIVTPDSLSVRCFETVLGPEYCLHNDGRKYRVKAQCNIHLQTWQALYKINEIFFTANIAAFRTFKINKIFLVRLIYY